jgi:hypothetical protein
MTAGIVAYVYAHREVAVSPWFDQRRELVPGYQRWENQLDAAP